MSLHSSSSPSKSYYNEKGVLNGLSPTYERTFGEKYSALYNAHIAGNRLAHDMTLEEYRETPVLLSFGTCSGPQVGTIEEVQCPVQDGSNIILRIYYPESYTKGQSKKLPCYMNIHGGGWVIGAINDDESFLRKIVAECHCIVVDVDYRLAPEYKYPIPIFDNCDAYAFLVSQAAKLGIDETKIAVGGFSAGGQMAAIICQRVRDGKMQVYQNPCFQLLVIPVVDASALDVDLKVRQDCPHESWREHHDAPFLSHARMSWFYHYFLPSGFPASLLHDPLLSPLLAKSFDNLPPALVVPAEVDVLRDEGIAIAQRLAKESGSWTQLWLAKSVPHPFPHQTEATEVAKEFEELAMRRLRQAFDGKLNEREFISNV